MSLVAGKAVPYFNNPGDETTEGSNYTLRFKVPFTGVETAEPIEIATMGPAALRASGIPPFGSQYPGNVAAYCNHRSYAALQQGTQIPTAQIVTCKFSTSANDNQNEEEDPLKKKPDVTWGATFERVVVLNAWQLQRTQNGVPLGNIIKGNKAPQPQKNFQNINQFNLGITNSCGLPFSPQPEADVPFLTCTIVQNLPMFDPTEAIAVIGTVNADNFMIDGETVRKGQALCMDRAAQIRYTGKFSYREVTTTLLFKNTHDLIILDKGFSAKRVEGKKFADVKDPKNDLIPLTNVGTGAFEEQTLDGNGNALKNNDGKKVVYLNYSYLKRTKFGSLGLPAARL